MTGEALYTLPGRPPFMMRVGRSLWTERLTFLATLAVLLGGSIAVIQKLPLAFESSAQVLIESARATAQLVSPDSLGIGDPEALGNRVDPINNQLSLIQSTPVFLAALNKAGLTTEEAPFGSLSAQVVAGTDVIEITYRAHSPQLAQKVVDALVSVYTEQNLLQNREKATAARRYLEKTLPELQQRLKQAQDQLEAFQGKNQFLGTPSELEGLTTTYNQISQQLNQSQADLAYTQQKMATLRTQIPGDLRESLRVAGLSQDPSYQALQAQLIQAETDLAALQARYTDDNTQVRSALDKRNRLKTLLKERSIAVAGSQLNRPLDPVQQGLVEQWFGLETERNAQAARLAQVSQQRNALQGRNRQLPELLKQHSRLQVEVEQAQQAYLSVADRFTASQILEQQSLGNVRVVEPASLTTDPVAPRTKVLYALALILSTGAALGVVWMRRLSDNRLLHTYDLTELLPLPILAQLPNSQRLSELERLEESPLLYPYQVLQAHLRMLPRQAKVVGICGMTRGAGSSVAENLALLEAQMGQRVILIETSHSPLNSLQRPILRRFSTSGKTTSPSSGRQSNPSLELFGFDILTYSVTSTLMFYRKWAMLLEKVRQRYDVIIVDCPPVGQDASATLLASLVDGILWVSEPAQMGRSGAQTAAETLRTWNTRLLGQVVMDSASPPQASLKSGRSPHWKTEVSLSDLTLPGQGEPG